MRKILFLFTIVTCLGASCHVVPEDRSAYARGAGESTMAVGSTCSRPLEKGFSACQLERGKTLPPLFLAFVNRAEYAVSDCELNLWKTGSIDSPKLIELDLAPLTAQVERNGFCILKIEAIEKFQDPRDKNQFHEIPLSGGFFIEVLEPGYFPVPSPDLNAFCQVYKIERTTKGRTTITQKGCGK